jgi:hypothetical protein
VLAAAADPTPYAYAVGAVLGEAAGGAVDSGAGGTGLAHATTTDANAARLRTDYKSSPSVTSFVPTIPLSPR